MGLRVLDHARLGEKAARLGPGAELRHLDRVHPVRAPGLASAQGASLGHLLYWKRGRHSEKPEAFYAEAFHAEVVEKVSPGPYVELFGRRPRPGWTVWGSDLTHEPQIQGVVSAA